MTQAEHIATICAQHEIVIGSHTSGGRAFRKSRRIKIRPVKSAVTYAIALHEIGHILGKRQSGNRIDKEVGAWEWAKTNAIEWTPVMTKTMTRCLSSYLRWTQRSKRAVKPESGHPVYALIG